MSIFLSNLLHYKIVRRFWKHERRDHWLSYLLEHRHEDDYFERWVALFRIRPATFDIIVNAVRERMEKEDTRFRKAIPIEHRVIIAIWRLSSGNTTRTIAEALSIGQSTVILISLEFCEAMFELSDQFIRFPRGRFETEEAINDFRLFTGCQIPMALGIVDGTQH